MPFQSVSEHSVSDGVTFGLLPGDWVVSMDLVFVRHEVVRGWSYHGVRFSGDAAIDAASTRQGS